MAFDPRDEIWNAVFKTYYNAYFHEIIAERLTDRWQLVDEVTKVLVALTVTSSTISGWAFWSDPQFHLLWVMLAGLGSVLAIVHAALGVPGRLKDWGEIRRWFASLRIDLGTTRQLMRIDANFPINDFTQQLVEYRKRYGQGVHLLKGDFLMTEKFRNAVQDDLEKQLASTIVKR